MVEEGIQSLGADIDLEKVYDRIDWTAVWDVLKVYGVGGMLMNGVKAFYKGAKACIKVNGETGESFGIHLRVRQGCVMSPWLFNLYMDGIIREMKAKVGDFGVEMFVIGGKWLLNIILFADDAVLVAENE